MLGFQALAFFCLPNHRLGPVWQPMCNPERFGATGGFRSQVSYLTEALAYQRRPAATRAVRWLHAIGRLKNYTEGC